MTDYEDEKYFTTKENVKATLSQYGVAIIPSVLSDEECKKMVSGLWDYFEHVTQQCEIPIDRNIKNSWKGFYTLYPKHSMLFQNWDVGHAQVSWDQRQNIKFIEIFAEIWDCKLEELLVSFDGLSFHIPPEETKRGWNRNNTWYHSDQSFTRNDFECIQSWVTGLDVEEGDATLAFYEGSHKLHKGFAETFDIKEKANWYKLNKDEELFFKENCLERKIKCPKGSLVLWDSRTIHCGVEAYRQRLNKKFRAVVYLCYMPRNKATEASLRKKQKAFNELRGTSHWAHKPKLFAKKPRTYGGPLPIVTPINKPILTELGKKLAGFN